MVSDKKQLLTEGSIIKKLILFTIPLFIGNLCQQLYNTADAAIVGKYLDKTDLAAVNSSGSLIFMLVSLFLGISVGAGVVISKYFGAQDEKNLKTAVHTTMAFGIAAGAILTLFGVFFTPHILRLMKTPEEVLPKSITYFRIYFYGAIPNVMYNISSGILRAVGDSRRPLYYLMASTAMNIVLDRLFIGTLGYGVGAAAFATILSQALSAILCCCRLVCCREVYRVEIRKIGFDGPMLRQIVGFGLPSGIQNSVIALANVFVQSNINTFGDSAMAGCGSYTKIEGFAFLPITCFAMGLTTFVGQNLGAKKHDRVKKASAFGIATSMILAQLIGVTISIFAPFFIRMFSDDPEVIAFGARQARIAPLFYFLLSFSHCVAGILRGAGKATVPMFTMLAVWCVGRVAYISVTLRYIYDIAVVFWAYPITWTISSVIFLIYFLRVDWIHTFDRMEEKLKTK